MWPTEKLSLGKLTTVSLADGKRVLARVGTWAATPPGFLSQARTEASGATRGRPQPELRAWSPRGGAPPAALRAWYPRGGAPTAAFAHGQGRSLRLPETPGTQILCRCRSIITGVAESTHLVLRALTRITCGHGDHLVRGVAQRRTTCWRPTRKAYEDNLRPHRPLGARSRAEADYLLATDKN